MSVRSSLSRARVKHSAAAVIAIVAAICAARQGGALAPLFDAANALAGEKLFVNMDSPARRQAEEWRGSRPADAALISYIASQATARWIGGWTQDVRGE